MSHAFEKSNITASFQGWCTVYIVGLTKHAADWLRLKFKATLINIFMFTLDHKTTCVWGGWVAWHDGSTENYDPALQSIRLQMIVLLVHPHTWPVLVHSHWSLWLCALSPTGRATLSHVAKNRVSTGHIFIYSETLLINVISLKADDNSLSVYIHSSYVLSVVINTSNSIRC